MLMAGGNQHLAVLVTGAGRVYLRDRVVTTGGRAYPREKAVLGTEGTQCVFAGGGGGGVWASWWQRRLRGRSSAYPRRQGCGGDRGRLILGTTALVVGGDKVR